MSSGLDKVTVLGTGVLGAQIIMQAAYAGKQVTAYDINDEALEKMQSRFDWMAREYPKDLEDFDKDRFDKARESVRATTDLADSVSEADIVIEAIPEILDLKKKVWAEVGEAAPKEAIFVTNSSSLRPSDFAEDTGRPEQFTTLHFANRVWANNTGEIMRTPQTSDETFDKVIEFAEEMNLVAIPIKKEVPGYILNSLLIPLLNAGSRLYINGIANPADIDRVWEVATNTNYGPFRIFDLVGFNVAYNISKEDEHEDIRSFAKLLKERGIDKDKTGVADGVGFYVYDDEGNSTGPNPDWELED